MRVLSTQIGSKESTGSPFYVVLFKSFDWWLERFMIEYLGMYVDAIKHLYVLKREIKKCNVFSEASVSIDWGER